MCPMRIAMIVVREPFQMIGMLSKTSIIDTVLRKYKKAKRGKVGAFYLIRTNALF